MSIFNDLVIKNDPVKKSKIHLCFYGGGSTASQTSLGTRRQNVFIAKFSVNSKFNISANFNLVSSTS